MRKLTLRRKSAPPRPRALAAGHAPVAREGVAEILGYPVQAKLTLGSPDDAHEREADAVADRVMAMPDARVQRKCADCAKEDEEHRPPQPEERQPDEEVRRKAEPGTASTASTAAPHNVAPGGPAGPAANALHAVPGHPLPAAERGFFESRMNAPLGHVRLHTDDRAARLAHDFSARAFTLGQDVYFGAGEYRPGTTEGRRLIAHELTHTLQQGAAGEVRRWKLGTAPAPYPAWSVVTDADQKKRLGEAEGIVSGVVASKHCQNHYKDRCTNGGGAGVLKDTFDKATVYLRPQDDNIFGEGEFGGHNLAFNLRAYRIGRYMLASTLLHEMFHNCDRKGAGTGRAAELSAENAVEACRLYTPWIDTLSRRSGPAGTRVTITGWNFGPTRSADDAVEIGGVGARIVSWDFMAGTSSRVQIVAEVPAGAGPGGVVVINNGVRSNAAAFSAT